jgi:hypothetical protein
VGLFHPGFWFYSLYGKGLLFLKALYVIGHNAVVVRDRKGRRCVVTGKGIGFMKEAGDWISSRLVQNVFVEESSVRD